MLKKLIMGGAIGATILIAAAAAAGMLDLGPLVKHAINFYGPAITMTDVRVGDVRVALQSGKAKVQDFYLGSPRGFSSRETMKVGSFYMDLDEKTVTEPTVIINRIEIERPEITYEKLEATDNFKTILDTIMQKIEASKLPEHLAAAMQAGAAKKMLIRHLLIRKGKVRLVMPGLGSRHISAPLPDIELKDVGQIEGGSSPEEVCKQVLSGLYEKITGSAVTGALNQELKGLDLSQETVGQGTVGGTKPMTEKVKGLRGAQP
jgi:hypothetical protein